MAPGSRAGKPPFLAPSAVAHHRLLDRLRFIQIFCRRSNPPGPARLIGLRAPRALAGAAVVNSTRAPDSCKVSQMKSTSSVTQCFRSASCSQERSNVSLTFACARDSLSASQLEFDFLHGALRIHVAPAPEFSPVNIAHCSCAPSEPPRETPHQRARPPCNLAEGRSVERSVADAHHLRAVEQRAMNSAPSSPRLEDLCCQDGRAVARSARFTKWLQTRHRARRPQVGALLWASPDSASEAVDCSPRAQPRSCRPRRVSA